ncbi:hypothetical protein JCGZ_01210 [Jatropha curcas]|uniref:Uncharacterized protein n=1 Tax=Jatropha curcas TaxID=180498 RepID=A0A067LJB9_JATCU|nr:hypothetical protein JCGZ_01210 [Jatropha curcas]
MINLASDFCQCARGGHGSGIEPKINGFGYGLEPNSSGSDFGSSMVSTSTVPASFSMVQVGFRPIPAGFGRFPLVSDGTRTVGSDWSWNRQFTVPKLMKLEPNRFGPVSIPVRTVLVPTGFGSGSHRFGTDGSGSENQILATPTLCYPIQIVKCYLLL